jgi:hypothetical protein
LALARLGLKMAAAIESLQFQSENHIESRFFAYDEGILHKECAFKRNITSLPKI